MHLVELFPASDEVVAADVLALQRAAYAVEAALIGDARIPPLHEDLASLRAAPLSWLGAVEGGRVVGAVALRRAVDRVELDRLVVAPGQHRRGVGSTLVAAVLDRAAGRPVAVSTGRGNRPARRLYERLGFVPTGDEEVLPGLWVTHLLHRSRSADEQRFLDLVLADPTVVAVLERMPSLGVPDAWLTAGVLFQSVWNGLTGREPGSGVRDADLFYFDPDTSWDAEDAVIRRGAELFADLPVPVEIRNQARVHLWYADRFGVPAAAPFRNCREAIDAFAAVCCSYGVTAGAGGLEVYAPYGYADLFGMVVRPTAGPAPREVYEGKAARWRREWPKLTVLPWEHSGPPRG